MVCAVESNFAHSKPLPTAKAGPRERGIQQSAIASFMGGRSWRTDHAHDNDRTGLEYFSCRRSRFRARDAATKGGTTGNLLRPCTILLSQRHVACTSGAIRELKQREEAVLAIGPERSKPSSMRWQTGALSRCSIPPWCERMSRRLAQKGAKETSARSITRRLFGQNTFKDGFWRSAHRISLRGEAREPARRARR